MRVTSMVAGLALMLAACGGGDQQADTQTTTADSAAAPAATGTTHEVEMTMVGTDYRFVPAEFTVKPGDVVRFTNVKGAPHNVMFFADSIPSGAAAALNAGMPDQVAPLTSQMLVQLGEVITVSFAGAPTGEYAFTCQPHQAMGMNGKITVQQ